MLPSSPDPQPAAAAEWRPAPAVLSLRAGEVHVWRARLDRFRGELAALMGLLSTDEQDRAGRFHFAQDREHYIAARALLRRLLGRYLDQAPEALQFRYSPHGKPELAAAPGGAGPDLYFNLSHSHGLAVYAVTHSRRIGIDVEQIRPGFAAGHIAERFFSAHEVASLRALPAALQEAAFFRCWTRKEAFIKAHGEGLSYPLDRFDVSLAPGAPASLLRIQGATDEARRWTLHDLPVDRGFVGAFAVEGTGHSIEHWRAD